MDLAGDSHGLRDDLTFILDGLPDISDAIHLSDFFFFFFLHHKARQEVRCAPTLMLG